MGGEARWEYFGEAEGRSRGGIRDEFGLTTGYNRKYAIRLLNGPPPSGGSGNGRGYGSHAMAKR